MTNLPIDRNTLQPLYTRACRSLLVLGVAAGMAATSVHAQVLVHDTGTIGAVEKGSESQLAQQIKGYKRDYDQLVTMRDRYTAMLTKIQNLGTGISLVPMTFERLTQAQTDRLVSQACPGAPLGGVVSGIISGLEQSANESIVSQQQLICKGTVLLQVHEYNITADGLSQLTVQASTVQNLSNVVSGISSLGESSSANSQAAQYMAQLQTASDTWKKQMDADDAMIETLKRQQGILANVALNGSNSVLGHVVNTIALKTAFTIND